MILVLHPIVNNDEVYACNLCIEGLDSEEDVKKHLKDKHDKVVEKDKEVSSSDMKLDIERLSFENEEHNKEEEETISIKENVTMTKDSFKECDLCDYKCRNEVTLNVHKNTEHGETYKCCKCVKTFKEKDLRNLHELIDHKPKQVEYGYPCMLCEKECTNIVDFSEHMETVHRNEKNLSCNECGQNITVLDMDTWCSCHLAEVIHLYSGNTNTNKGDGATKVGQCQSPADGM